MPALGLARFEGLSSQSWLLTGVVGDAPARVAAALLFLAPMLGFVIAGAAFFLGEPWWRPLAVASAVVSLAGTALFPQAFSTGSTVGSVAVNAIVLYGILVAGWGATSATA
jgi:hypothetical protein